MERAVYYFTGTGNTLCLAREVAKGLHAQLYPIDAFREAETVEMDAQLIGIVFPVYYSDAPVIVQEFIGKIRNLADKTVFAICTFGGAAGDSLRTVRRLLKEQGAALSLAFGVPMPQNSFYKWYENPTRRIAILTKRCKRMVKAIQRGATGIHYHNYPLEWMMVPVTKYIIKPVCTQYFVEKSGLDKDASVADMVRRMDRGFETLDVCTSCGICAQVCPVKNIVITDGRPVWQHHCENCLACYNWCPQQAITGGITKKGYFYHHPKTKVKDFIRK